MRARSIAARPRLSAEPRRAPSARLRGLLAAVRRELTSTDYARIQARVEDAREEHLRRALRVSGRQLP